MKSSIVRTAVAAMCAVALVACDDSTGPDGTTRLSVLLTDAPSDYIESAEVDIGAVELLGGEGGPIRLADEGTEGFVDLMDLRGVATQALADIDIPSGTYTQLRLVVQGARVTLAGDYVFNGTGENTADLTVPSGAQTGIKLNLSAGDAEGTEGGVEISGGQTVLVVDFDVEQSFRIQGNPDTPAGINSVSFRPTLRVVVNDIAGTISGVVSTELAEYDLAGLVVTAEPLEGTTLEPYQSMTATATTLDGTAEGTVLGEYTIYFLVPGDYDVSLDAGEGFVTEPATETVTVEPSQNVTDVDFVVIEGAGG